MRKRLLARVAAAAAGGALAFAAAAPAFADDDGETAVTTVPDSSVTVELGDIPNDDGPDDCAGETGKLDDMGDAPGQWDQEIGDATIQITGDGEKHYEFSISGEIDGEQAFLHAIHIKGSTGDKSYYFDPPVTEAANLTAPENSGGNLADASHIWFCVGDGETPTPGPSPTSTPTPSPTGPPEATPTPTPSAPGNGGGDDDGELPVTGAQVGGMVVLAGGLIAAGIALLAVRSRRNLSDLMEG